jgi:hypothetical protein
MMRSSAPRWPSATHRYRLPAGVAPRGATVRCSASCRAAASKKRRADAFWSNPQGEAVLAALPAIALEQPQRGDVVALTVHWARGVVGRMAGHGREADPRIACRSELVGKALAAALDENFPSR